MIFFWQNYEINLLTACLTWKAWTAMVPWHNLAARHSENLLWQFWSLFCMMYLLQVLPETFNSEIKHNVMEFTEACFFQHTVFNMFTFRASLCFAKIFPSLRSWPGEASKITANFLSRVNISTSTLSRDIKYIDTENVLFNSIKPF